MQCPRCNGDKMTVATHVSYADGSYGFGVPLACDQCEGKGEVPEEMTQWIEDGKRLRERRKEGRVTLRDEAKRRGITPSTLSAMEFGKIKPVFE